MTVDSTPRAALAPEPDLAEPRVGKPPLSTNQLIGMRIRERRMILGLTQPQFAELIGVTFQQVHKYECGKNSISAGRLYEIARGSGTPVEYFFEGLQTNEGQPPPCQSMLLAQSRQDPERKVSGGDWPDRPLSKRATDLDQPQANCFGTFLTVSHVDSNALPFRQAHDPGTL
jgi:transcriptional regulator with XRE-family HTH domain